MKKVIIVVVMLLLMGSLVYWLSRKKPANPVIDNSVSVDPTGNASLPPNSNTNTSGANPYHPGSVEYCLRMFGNMTVCQGLPPDSTFH